MEKHYGQIVEYLVRKNGYSITELATELKVNRRSIYNYFQNRLLKSDVIIKIGRSIRHDFSEEFPEILTPKDFEHLHKQGEFSVIANMSQAQHIPGDFWKDKYLNLLENYNQALLQQLSFRKHVNPPAGNLINN